MVKDRKPTLVMCEVCRAPPSTLIEAKTKSPLETHLLATNPNLVFLFALERLQKYLSFPLIANSRSPFYRSVAPIAEFIQSTGHW